MTDARAVAQRGTLPGGTREKERVSPRPAPAGACGWARTACSSTDPWATGGARPGHIGRWRERALPALVLPPVCTWPCYYELPALPATAPQA
jgi:hypothetical protein